MSYDFLENRLHLKQGTISELLACSFTHRHALSGLKHRRSLFAGSIRYRKPRQVYIPCDALKSVQYQIKNLISDHFVPHPIAHAYVKTRSIITNARQHLNARSILHFDLINFFGSINQSMVRESLSRLLSDWIAEDIDTLVRLCCVDGALPQGFPASPILANLVCYAFDEQLQNIGRLYGCTVTRYSDDISFSTQAPFFPSEIATLSFCEDIIEVGLSDAFVSLVEEHGFAVNYAKLRYQHRPNRLYVTGLTVTDRVKVPKEVRHRIRAILHRWQNDGVDRLVRRAQSQYSAQDFVRSIRGGIDYIGQVDGKDDRYYKHLLASFEMLVERDLKPD